ncbi:stalk domain-containing protein [Microbacteriaceae bacterium 4G12]
MRKKQILLLLIAFCLISPARALGDKNEREDHDKYEKYEKKEKNEKHDEDDDDKKERRKKTETMAPTPNSWTNWNRTTERQPTFEAAPAELEGNISMTYNNESIAFTAKIINGELYVPFRDVGNLMKAVVIFYGDGKYGELVRGDRNLLICSESTVAYENGNKTPLPSKVIGRGEQMLVPLSVLVSSFSLIIERKEKTLVVY